MNQSHSIMESCFGNSAVAAESDAASDDRQLVGRSLQRVIGSQENTESHSPRYQLPTEILSPPPDSFQHHEEGEMKCLVAVDQQSGCTTTTDSPLKIPVGVNIKDTVTPDEKEVHTKSDALKEKTATQESKSPSHNIQCIPQLINGVKCITFTTPEDNGRKRTADRDDGVTKGAKRRLVFPDACDTGTNPNVKRQADGTNGFSRQGIEKASTRADRIVTSLQWDVVKILREATMLKGKDIVLVKPRGLSWAPSLSALRDKDGTLTVLSDSNMAALFQIEDQLNIYLSTPDVAVSSLANSDRGAKSKPTGNVDQKERSLNREMKETNLPGSVKQSKRNGTPTPGNRSRPVKPFTDEIDIGKENKRDDEPFSLKTKYGDEECTQKADSPTGKILPELQTPTKGTDADDEVRVMKAALQLLSEIDISTDQCIDFNAIDHAFEEVDKNLQFIDESKRHSYELDQAVAGLYTDWDQISEKLLRDLESIERRLSLAVTEQQGQSSINMELFGEISFEDDHTYSSLSPEQQQKYLDMLIEEPSTLTPYDEIIFGLIGNDL